MRQESIGASNMTTEDPYLDRYTISIVVDTETTNFGPTGDAINPSVPSNYVLQASMYTQLLNRPELPLIPPEEATITSVNITEMVDSIHSTRLKYNSAILVGHNIKFDLRYLIRAGLNYREPYILIWDTAVFDYLFHNMAFPFPSLEETALRLGIDYNKDTYITDWFKSGKPFDEIDRGLLAEYCNDDVRATYAVYLKQFEMYKECPEKFQKLVREQMAFIKPLTMMEHEGQRIDIPRIQREYLDALNTQTALSKDINETVEEHFGFLPSSPTSNKTISTMLYGLPGVKQEVRELVGTYKTTGKPKYKNQTIIHTPTPISLDISPTGVFNTITGYPVGEDVLTKHAPKIPICNKLLAHRKLSKLIGTYYEPMLEWVMATGLDTSHPYYNNTATATGRLSSSKPNGQNRPEEISKLLIPNHNSRFRIDCKQLEVVGLAQVTKDPQLIKDLREGVDIHNEIGKMVYLSPHTMNDKERRIVKGVVFGTIYGGGPATLSKQSGVDLQTVSLIQDSFFQRYKTLRSFYDDVLVRLVKSKTATGKILPNGHKEYEYFMDSITGRVYRIPDSKLPTALPSWTALRNYPIQGLATGDIVPLLINLMFDTMLPSTTLTSTIHDSIDIDTWLSIDYVRVWLDEVFGNLLPKAFEEWTGEPLVAPIKYTIKEIGNEQHV